MSNKKFLLIFPPSFSTVEPHLACPSLVAQLRTNGFESKVWDANIDFANYIFTSEYVKNSYIKAKEDYDNLSSIKRTFLKKKNTYENKILNAKFENYEYFFERNSEEETKNIINAVDKAVEIYKNPKYFYNYKNIIKAQYVMDKASEIISLPFFPLKIDMFKSNISNNIMPLEYEKIKRVIFDSSVNIYSSFFEKKINQINAEKYNFIGISINFNEQLIAGLTLANLLKMKTNAHICIGGSFFTRIKENIEKYPEIFKIFVDSFLYGEGEKSIIELAKFISNEINISDVKGLIYLKNNKVICNPEPESCLLSKISIPDFSDYDFSKYYTPEKVIPIQTQRGCYWRKCIFCDMSYAKTYTTKNIKSLIEEIKFYKNNYGISNFDIIDEAIVPLYFEKVCDEIIKENLNVNFQIYLRFEKEINENFLQKVYQAGVRHIQWGVETGNERIHNLINKGVDFNNRLNILKSANKVGILNCVFTIFGFPSETFQEAMDTYNFVFDNIKYIQSCGTTHFKLARHSTISNNPTEYGVKIIGNQQDFSSYFNSYLSVGMTQAEKENYLNIFSKTYFDNYKNTIFSHLDGYTLLFLYNCKYNLEYLKRINTKKL